MAISFYSASVPVFSKFLGNLILILDKLGSQAQAKNQDPSVYLDSRLYPDMFALSKQLHRVADIAAGGIARIAGVDVPEFGSDAAALSDHIVRIRRAIDFLTTIKPEQIDGAEERIVSYPRRDQTISVQAERYFLNNVQPNFWFHLTTAYAILRHNGVDIGKQDFVGRS